MATAHFCFDLVKTEVIKNQPFLLQTCRYMQFRRCQNKRKVKIESKWTGLFLGKWTGLNLSKISVEKFANWSFVWKKGGKKIQRKLEQLLRIWKPISKLEEKVWDYDIWILPPKSDWFCGIQCYRIPCFVAARNLILDFRFCRVQGGC